MCVRCAVCRTADVGIHSIALPKAGVGAGSAERSESCCKEHYPGLGVMEELENAVDGTKPG